MYLVVKMKTTSDQNIWLTFEMSWDISVVNNSTDH